MSLTVMDPGFVVPDGVSEKDPNHPMSIFKTAISQQSQAAADQRYDPRPKRISVGAPESSTESSTKSSTEGFVDFNNTMIMTTAFLAVFMIIVWISVSQTMTTTYALILTLALATLFGIQYSRAAA